MVAPHTGADVQIEPLAAVPWDGYGRLLKGGRGDGLAGSVAAAARRFAHPGRGRLAAARAADALAARRVRPPGAVFADHLLAARAPVADARRSRPSPRGWCRSRASAGRAPTAAQASSAGRWCWLLAAAFLVRAPSLPLRRRNTAA